MSHNFNEPPLCQWCHHINHPDIVCPIGDCTCMGIIVPYNPQHTIVIQKKMVKIMETLFKGKGYTYPELIVGTYSAITELAFHKAIDDDSK